MQFSNLCDCENKAFVFVAETKSWICVTCKTVMRISMCREGCKTQDHETYWDCLQFANIAIDKSSLKG